MKSTARASRVIVLALLYGVVLSSSGLAAPSDSATSAKGRGLFTEILTIDCAGAMHLLPSHPLLSTDIAIGDRLLARAFDFLQNAIKDQAKCHCPGITADYLQRGFNFSVGSALMGLQNKTSPSHAGCTTAQTSFRFSVDQLFEDVYFDPVSSCLAGDWMAGKPCLLNFVPETIFHSFQLALDHCPGTEFPYISISAAGDIMSSLGALCVTNSDCPGSSLCSHLSPDIAAGAAWDTFRSWLDSAGIFGMTDSCQTYNSNTVATKIFQLVQDYLASTMGVGVAGQNLGICLPTPIRDFFWTPPDAGYYPYYPWPWYRFLFYAADIASGMLPNVKSWDGILPSGQSVVAESRKDGSFFDPLPNASWDSASDVTLLDINCNSQVVFLKGTQLEVRINLPPVHSLINFIVTEAMSPVVHCRAASRKVDLAAWEFQQFYNPASPLFWWSVYSNPVPAFTVNPFSGDNFLSHMADWVSYTWDSFTLPLSCSWSSYNATQECLVNYTHLQTLFDSPDINVYGTFQQCTDKPNAIPRFTIKCVGSMCAKALQPYKVKLCQQDSDCPEEHQQCQHIDGINIKPFLWSNPLPLPPAQQCVNESVWDKVLYQMVLAATNQPAQNYALPLNYRPGFCPTPLNDIFRRGKVENWAEDAASRRYNTTTGKDVFTVAGLNSVTQCPTGTGTPSCVPCPACNTAHSRCDEGLLGTATCLCDDGYTGPTCFACASGYFAPVSAPSTCRPCACSSIGSHSCAQQGGQCMCNRGFVGATCSACAAGYFGARCSVCPACGAHGKCDQGRDGSGLCLCDAGWSGSSCSAHAHCGNRKVEAGEECDPGNVTMPGCVDCSIQPGYSCFQLITEGHLSASVCEQDTDGVAVTVDASQPQPAVLSLRIGGTSPLSSSSSSSTSAAVSTLAVGASSSSSSANAGFLSLQLPAGLVPVKDTLRVVPVDASSLSTSTSPNGTKFSSAGAFSITLYSGLQPTFSEAMTVKLGVGDSSSASVCDTTQTLLLYDSQSDSWVDASSTCLGTNLQTSKQSVDVADSCTLTARVCQLGNFATVQAVPQHSSRSASNTNLSKGGVAGVTLAVAVVCGAIGFMLGSRRPSSSDNSRVHMLDSEEPSAHGQYNSIA